MEIIKLGHASFKIKSKQGVLVTDPFDPDFVGLNFPKIEAKIVTISHQHSDHNYKAGFLGNPVFIEGPGEYEVADIFIKGVATEHDEMNGSQRGKNTIYRLEIEGLALAHLGDLGHKLKEEQVEALGDIDVLFVPVGGVYTIGPKLAVEVVNQIEPQIIIPMHYREPGLNQNNFGVLSEVKDFFAQIGKEVTTLPKLVISQDKIPTETMVVALTNRL